MDLVEAALSRPRVRVNQVGYLPDGPKHATVLTDRPQPLPFAVRSGARTVWRGRTEPAPTAAARTRTPTRPTTTTGPRPSST